MVQSRVVLYVTSGQEYSSDLDQGGRKIPILRFTGDIN